MRVGQHLVHHPEVGLGGKGRCALRAQHDQVGLLRPCLKEQFFSRVARRHNRLHGDPAPKRNRNQGDHLVLYLVDTPAGKNLMPLLGLDHMLQNQARVVLCGQLRRKTSHHGTGFMQADAAQNAPEGKVAVRPVHHLRTDDENRH